MSINIALKSLNQYRKRDIIAYLSLRYYLASKSSQTDLWANEVAVKLALKKQSSRLLKIKHFKSFNEGRIEYRDIFIPSPNDIIAESALITKCSEFEAFQTNSSVYSYLMNKDNRSVFQHYSNGLKKRYKSIKSACLDTKNEEIMYLDVKSFYPSIDLNLLKRIWTEACFSSQFPQLFTDLGIAFIEKYRIEQKEIEKPGLLIGPMFSHLLANLYLKNLDKKMKSMTNNRYWRYVDDIVLVGNKFEIEVFSKNLKNEISLLGLQFHNELKTFRLQTNEWLANKNPLGKSLSKKWPELVGHIKRLAIFYPERIEELENILDKMDVRLEILEYMNETKSKTLSIGLFKWIKWYTSARELTPRSIATMIDEIRKEYLSLFYDTLKRLPQNELETKSKITKAKYLVGRLIYLSKKSDLQEIAKAIKDFPELYVQYEIIRTILTGDISNIIKLGTNAAQATAQVIKNKIPKLTCRLDSNENDVILAISIFKFHSIEIEFIDNEIEIHNPFYDFASGKMTKMNDSGDSYLHELIALHGEEESRHSKILNSLFDENETLSFDVLNAGTGSSYYE
ncbi:RNA-directed DNA polymerase [Aquimarina litoralis]|uniref:RNA-directed DNA polymerase n=1 Tax=Aquimarina litoralis TaxID=584605 RepID=UPI001C59EA0D|nr:RNA-directed DNA polymerase [Aquimarina litoralis]MBW1294042.1 hypothetical protein [Aquimarina litoralis]